LSARGARVYSTHIGQRRQFPEFPHDFRGNEGRTVELLGGVNRFTSVADALDEVESGTASERTPGSSPA
jgi:hypothetical protein